MKLTFKKAFGFDFVSADAAFWMFELGQKAYPFAVRATPVAISQTDNSIVTEGDYPFHRKRLPIDGGRSVSGICCFTGQNQRTRRCRLLVNSRRAFWKGMRRLNSRSRAGLHRRRQFSGSICCPL